MAINLKVSIQVRLGIVITSPKLNTQSPVQVRYGIYDANLNMNRIGAARLAKRVSLSCDGRWASIGLKGMRG